MRPLGAVFTGTLLVMLDLRFEGFDLLPDPVGWGLVLWAGIRLLPVHPALRWFVGAALVGLLVSLPGQLGELDGLLGIVSTLADLTALFAMCTAIHARSLDARRARQAGLVRWWDLGLTLVVLLVASQADSIPSDAEVAFLPVIVLGIALAIWYLVIVWSLRDEPTFGGSATGSSTGPVPGPGSGANQPTA